MNTVFVGGSRRVSNLPAPVEERLKNIVSSGHRVILGDANGADEAVQKFLAEALYAKVTVFCSGENYRNNIGQWPTRKIATSGSAKGFQFYAAKDRCMAQEADFGFLIWDGKSPGTILNVLRLIRAGKMAVLFETSGKQFSTFKNALDWDRFMMRLSPSIVADLRARATPEEWIPARQMKPQVAATQSMKQLLHNLNAALEQADTMSALATLGEITRMHGMSQIAKDSGLARESLYRSLKGEGNPEFITVLRVMQALGLHLRVDCEEEAAVQLVP